MRKILLAAAMVPFLAGAALAAGPGPGGGSPHASADFARDSAAGVSAYANANQLWRAERTNPAYTSGLYGWLDTGAGAGNAQQQG